MKYLEYHFTGLRSRSDSEILVALLNDAGFDGFEETDEELLAYILQDNSSEINLDHSKLDSLLSRFDFPVDYHYCEIPDINWNEKWESNFQPVQIENRVLIRASFHDPVPDLEYDLVINPKMSFGTGHHITTRLMIRAMLTIEIVGKHVLDMGCGTGILSVLASKMGAEKVHGIDIDEWSFKNSIENASVNHILNASFIQGSAQSIGEEKYDLILANINRNVLLKDMHFYNLSLKRQGIIIISGFMINDESSMNNLIFKLGFKKLNTLTEQEWVAIILQR